MLENEEEFPDDYVVVTVASSVLKDKMEVVHEAEAPKCKAGGRVGS